MRFTAFSFLFLISTFSVAQHTIRGIIHSSEDSTDIAACVVYLNDGTIATTADDDGSFVFSAVASGKYTLHFIHPGFKYRGIDVVVSTTDRFIDVYLDPYKETLQDVVITDSQTGFGFTRLRAVENLGIYEGKKTEVIILDQLTANLATNNARQVYARVAGLNIWENDGAGIQLSIGGRGLDPNRTSNFNVRQNGYDISADALGYPESYYTPPTEGIDKIQIVRGAASLQYGTQFGGYINFAMKKPPEDKKAALLVRQSVGSFGFYNSFISVGGTNKKFSYYSFFQYKRGDGWRKNSHFDNYSLYTNLNYQINASTKIGLDYTHMDYLAQQPGGLSDRMFAENPRQTNRERNWFDVNWNLFALHFDKKFTTSEFNLRVFGLLAHRYAVGFRPNRVETIDDNSERDLIKGEFRNWGTEARFLKRYNLGSVNNVLLVGARYYQGLNYSKQGLGTTGKDADFDFVNPSEYITYDYRFPNQNTALFLENIFYLTDKLSITPGIRFEYIKTVADGYYGSIYRDLAGNILDITRTDEYLKLPRNLIIGGIGISYKVLPVIELYGNISQNFRSFTFTDMRITNPSYTIDPNLSDETGYSIDLGIRSDQTSLYSYDLSLFYLNYNNRIGETQYTDENNRVLRSRGNIGQAVIQGAETYAEVDLLKLLRPTQKNWSGVFFNNVAFIYSNYTESELPVTGNSVEFAPAVNLKNGIRVSYKDLKASFQYTYLAEQYTDATNATDGGASAVVGLIPAYSIMDLSISYTYKRLKVEGNINNLADKMYFTRRATGYPGPGIIPSDGRSFYFTIQVAL